MPWLYGKHYSREELMRRIGNLDQICQIQSFEYSDGRAAQTKGITVDTGSLSFTLLPSRGLDIINAQYHGIPFGYLSKSGIRNPQYFNENDSNGFLDNFFGGLLTTSGLNNIGSPSIVDGRIYGMHGEATNIPAEHVSIQQFWKNDELFFSIKAQMKHSRFYAEDLLFTREILTSLGSSKIMLRDTIENLDFIPVPIFLLYHINFGFPLVDEHAKIICNCIQDIQPRTQSATAGLKTASTFQLPEDKKEEECFYYYFNKKDVTISLQNPHLGLNGMEAYLKYNTEQFPEFVEWKMMRSREYVCGFSPATNRLEGRDNALKNEHVRYLNPLEKVEFEIELGIKEII